MKLVKQTKLGECGPACIAMVAGVSLKRALEVVGDTSSGTTDDKMIEVLAQFHIPALLSLTWPSYDISAIASVPSLNHTGLNHYIVWTGSKWLDPGGPKTYPNDCPIVANVRLDPQWSGVILLWPKSV